MPHLILIPLYLASILFALASQSCATAPERFACHTDMECETLYPNALETRKARR